MALVAHFDLELHQMDVKTTFFNGDINEMINMMQTRNFVLGDPMKIISKLKKSINGLKQASTQWYQKFHQVIILFGFERNVVDNCVYHKFIGSKYIFLVLYVDDILPAIVMLRPSWTETSCRELYLTFRLRDYLK